MKISKFQMFAIGAIASGALLLGACGSDDKKDSTTGTTVEATTGTTAAGESAETVKFDKSVQEDLKKVGCYSGAVDGIIGPETDAAIVAFQEAEGLEADGEFGPETQAALDTAVKDGTKVCTSTSGTTSTSSTTTPSTPPCTATAVSVVLASGSTLESYVCSGDYAGIQWKGSSGTTEGAVLIVKGGKWTTEEPSPCGAASAGIPAQVLEVGCIPA